MAVDIKLQRAKQRSRRLKGLSYVGPDDTKVVDVGVTQIETHPVPFQPHEFLGKGDTEHHIAPGQNPLNKKARATTGAECLISSPRPSTARSSTKRRALACRKRIFAAS
jgi:hypothetical protein